MSDPSKKQPDDKAAPPEPARRPLTRTPPEMVPTYSSGHLIRDAHRAMQRHLEDAITTAGVSRGQWYFLRVLWEGDGLTQRELSARVGMMEPTTVVALNGMEKAGLIRRERNPEDRRKIHIYLTDKGAELRNTLLPLAKAVNDRAEVGIDPEDLAGFRRAINRMIENLAGDRTAD